MLFFRISTGRDDMPDGLLYRSRILTESGKITERWLMAFNSPRSYACLNKLALEKRRLMLAIRKSQNQVKLTQQHAPPCTRRPGNE
ncbi:hypothetical protein ARC272_07400 [Pantoea ananatis]|nr:hypothetical protein ARC272_07400 [Pantoea ananatis]